MHKKITHTHKHQNQNRGFTLIEMSIVILTLGVMTAMFSQVYSLYRETVAIEETESAVDITSNIIGDFRAIHGRYPCPASLTLSPTDPNYGREDCGDYSATSAGNCSNGICIRESVRSFAYINPHDDTDIGNKKARVLIGTLPFRNLNIDENKAYDGYNNRITYAITEHLTNEDSYQNNGGGIEIIGDSSVSILPANALGETDVAHFMIYSSGKNEVGAHNRSGTVIHTCPSSGLESFNCNMSLTDSSFRLTQQSADNDLNNRNDDIVAFFTPREMTPWQRSEALGHHTDTHLRIDDSNAGFGLKSTEIPEEELHVDGTIRLQDNPDTDIDVLDDPSTPEIEGQEGKLQTEKICEVGDGTKCFKSSLIAGEVFMSEINGEEVNIGGGLYCPEGSVMRGIQEGNPICEKEFEIKCKKGYFMTGIDENGNILCNEPPKNPCKKTTKEICEEDAELKARNHGKTNWTAKVGEHTKQEEYICNDGTWEKTGRVKGACACEPTNTFEEKEYSCEDTDKLPCGSRYDGTIIKKRQLYKCPPGQGNYWKTIEIQNNCICLNTSAPDTENCPKGYNEGKQYGYNEHICTSEKSGSCSGFIHESNTCVCVPDKREEERNCPGDYSGKYTVIKTYYCNQPPIAPVTSPSGKWTGWEEIPGDGIDENCICEEKDLTPYKESCPIDGYEGEITYPRRIVCINGSPEEIIDMDNPTDTCKPPPAASCYWTIDSYVGGNNSPLRNAGDPCSCSNDAEKNVLCGNGGDNYVCTCGK